MTKITLTPDQKKRVKDVLAENHLAGNKLTLKELGEKAGVSPGVVCYYKRKWGYSKKQTGKKKSGKRSTDSAMTLAEAVRICKSNGLKVLKETVKVEEL